ncbi:type II toxin-antitoxin system YafO family toxin [Candidatus Nitrotoga sp. M5]|uniref:type II toxin-antitoxin system YafO family toxin n=1 Tax=Candidatus Nitrotoga sp. M5 TaxID=2890409 RepID=UPI001EF6CC06|nr:type II toxin-antitoxin system YafO family toxin [Candidatus Nitrotoga sp. M5]CAH1388320.1 ribosome-dependent mRNA interferase toxin YafO [Candidatus Nitrotoga sp. M5]
MRVFKSTIIQKILSKDELATLVSDFIKYKETGVPPDTFGRDVPFDHPHTLPIVKAEDVKHLHLANADNPFPTKKIQFYRCSDEHLVYCEGILNPSDVLFITILSPDAHHQERQNETMYRIGLVAENFRKRY